MNYEKTTFKNLISSYLDMLHVERNLSPKTIQAYQYDLNQFCHWLDTNHFTELNIPAIRNYFAALQHLQLKPRTLQRKYISLGQFFRYLNQEGYSHEHFLGFSSRKFHIPQTLPRTLQPEEIRRLISSVESEYNTLSSPYRRLICTRDKILIELLFCLGLRISEVSQLNLSHYNPIEKTLLIHGKRSKERLLYISSPEVCKKLDDWIAVRPNLNPCCDALFLNRFGKRLSVYGIEKTFQKYRDKDCGCNLHIVNPAVTLREQCPRHWTAAIIHRTDHVTAVSVPKPGIHVLGKQLRFLSCHQVIILCRDSKRRRHLPVEQLRGTKDLLLFADYVVDFKSTQDL